MHEDPVVLRAENLNPAIGAHSGTALRAADTLLGRSGEHGVGLIARKGNHLGRQRALGDLRHIGGIHGDNRSVIRHGRPAQQHQNQEERYKPFHLFPSLFVKGRTEKGFPVLVIQVQCCLIADMRLG